MISKIILLFAFQLLWYKNINEAATPDDLNCLQIACNFEQEDLCGYENSKVDDNAAIGISKGTGATKEWKLTQGMQKNRATGVRKPGEGLFYVSTYLLLNDSAILISHGRIQNTEIRFMFPLVQDRVIKFKYYKVTTGITLKGCCETVNNCPYSTQTRATITDFDQWKSGSFICSAGTQKVLFYGFNEGRNEGGIGVDSIELLNPNGDDPEQADQNVCDSDKSLQQSDLLNFLMNIPVTETSLNNSTPTSANQTSVNVQQKSMTNNIVKNKNISDNDKSENSQGFSNHNDDTTTTVNTDNIEVILIPGDSRLADLKNPPVPLRRFRRYKNFEDSVLRDSFILSSRIYLAANNSEAAKNAQNREKSSMINSLNVGGIPIEDLHYSTPSGGINIDENEEEK